MSKPQLQARTVLATAEDIPSVLRQLRVTRGLSQRELANKAKTKASVICRLEIRLTAGIPLRCCGALARFWGWKSPFSS
jgi:Predicted transcription factor, homolog of eukaryotic MBF1